MPISPVPPSGRKARAPVSASILYCCYLIVSESRNDDGRTCPLPGLYVKRGYRVCPGRRPAIFRSDGLAAAIQVACGSRGVGSGLLRGGAATGRDRPPV